MTQKIGTYREVSALIIFLVILSLCSASTIRRNQLWSSEVILWEDVVSKVPSSHRGYNNLGLSYAAAGMHEEAIEAFNKSIMRYPYPQAYNNLGREYFQKGLYSKAVDAFSAAVEIFPTFAEAHNNLGYIYYKLRLYDKSIDAFREAGRLKPALVQIDVNLGNVYRAKGEIDKAREQYLTALSKDPGYALARRNLNALMEKSGR
ncbi:MAG: tetratricopeptide repeat protein [Thermodesulfobacteriota bacterium]